jgi:hypothetical protein
MAMGACLANDCDVMSAPVFVRDLMPGRFETLNFGNGCPPHIGRAGTRGSNQTVKQTLESSGTQC